MVSGYSLLCRYVGCGRWVWLSVGLAAWKTDLLLVGGSWTRLTQTQTQVPQVTGAFLSAGAKLTAG